jgi:hypothetical protein
VFGSALLLLRLQGGRAVPATSACCWYVV